MKKKKNMVLCLAAVLLAAVYIFFPRAASDLVIEITFWEVTGNSCRLYYTTDTQTAYGEEQSIAGDIDYDTMTVSFRLDGSLEGHLTGLRLDFPQEEQLMSIKAVTVSSAGVIQKDFNPSVFFADDNITAVNDLVISVVDSQNRAYISTRSQDPYLVLSDSLVEQIVGCYSHQTVSRLLVCVFIAACFVIARRRIFALDTDPGRQTAKPATQAT